METTKKNTYFEAELVFDEDVSEDLKKEIIDVLKSARFNKLSYPIASYRNLIAEDTDEEDTKIITVGYIKKFIKDENKFIFNIFNNCRTAVKSFIKPAIKISFTEYDGKLGVISKIIVVDNV